MNIPLNIDWQQILLHLLNFTILFGILYFLLYKPVKDFMDKRTEYYKKQEKDIADRQKQAEESKEEYEKRLTEVQDEINSRKAKAAEEAAAAGQEVLRQAGEEAQELINKARIDGEREKEKILSGAKDEIAQMIETAAAKLAPDMDSSMAYDRFLDAAESDALQKARHSATSDTDLADSNGSREHSAVTDSAGEE